MIREFKGVAVVVNANIYFHGNVTSRTILFPDGNKKTLGIILPGTYEFEVGDEEEVEIISGSADVLLPHTSDWRNIKIGESFKVDANTHFQIRSTEIVDYICSYLTN